MLDDKELEDSKTQDAKREAGGYSLTSEEQEGEQGMLCAVWTSVAGSEVE